MFFCRPLFILMLGVMALAGVDHDVLAQGTGEKSKSDATEKAGKSARLVSSGWAVGCKPNNRTGKLLCEAKQTIAVGKTRKTLLVVFVTPWQRADGPESFAFRFQLPHGLDLPAGVQILIDDKPAASPVIQTSSPSGVFARTELTDPFLASLKKGSAMKVSFTAINGTRLTIPVTLKGFSAVFAKLKKS